MARKGNKIKNGRKGQGLTNAAMVSNYIGQRVVPAIDPPTVNLNPWFRQTIVGRFSTSATAGTVSQFQASDLTGLLGTQTGISANSFKVRLLSIRWWAMPTAGGAIIPTMLVIPYSFYALAQDPIADLLDFGTAVDPARAGWTFGVPTQAQVYDSTDTGVRIYDISSTNTSQSIYALYEVMWKFF